MNSRHAYQDLQKSAILSVGGTQILRAVLWVEGCFASEHTKTARFARISLLQILLDLPPL